MTSETDESSDNELEFDSEPENGDELNLTSNQREVLTRVGDHKSPLSAVSPNAAN